MLYYSMIWRVFQLLGNGKAASACLVGGAAGADFVVVVAGDQLLQGAGHRFPAAAFADAFVLPEVEGVLGDGVGGKAVAVVVAAAVGGEKEEAAHPLPIDFPALSAVFLLEKWQEGFPVQADVFRDFLGGEQEPAVAVHFRKEVPERLGEGHACRLLRGGDGFLRARGLGGYIGDSLGQL